MRRGEAVAIKQVLTERAREEGDLPDAARDHVRLEWLECLREETEAERAALFCKLTIAERKLYLLNLRIRGLRAVLKTGAR